MKRFKKFLSVFIVVAIILCSAPLNGFVGLELPDWLDFTIKAEALTEGIYTYTVTNGEAKITDCDENVSGDIFIPSTIGGYPVTSIGDYAFYNCSGLTGDLVIPDSVRSIGDSAFRHCSGLTSATIPNSVIRMGSSVFNNCDSLTSVIIGNSVTSIESSAFYDCDSLTSVIIGNSVTSIESSAFYSCDSLTGVEIPDSVTSIGASAFYDCDSLISVEIPDSVTNIGNYAFSGCGGLISVKLSDSVTSISYELFSYCLSLTNVTIGNGVTIIEKKAFYCCRSLLNVTIPGSVINIGENAFTECDDLTSVTISNGVSSIGQYAFSLCGSLKSVTMGSSITSIAHCAFTKCKSLENVYYKSTEERWKSITFGGYNDELKNATIHFLGEKPIETVEGLGAVIDDETKTIYGLEEGIYDLEGYVEYEGCVLEYNPTAFGFGTGTTVDFVVDGEIIDTYTIVIFGDINGDGYVDAFDVPDVMAFVDYNSHYGEGSPQELAADVNGDGYVDELDLFTVDLASTFAYTIKQSR